VPNHTGLQQAFELNKALALAESSVEASKEVLA